MRRPQVALHYLCDDPQVALHNLCDDPQVALHYLCDDPKLHCITYATTHKLHCITYATTPKLHCISYATTPQVALHDCRMISKPVCPFKTLCNIVGESSFQLVSSKHQVNASIDTIRRVISIRKQLLKTCRQQM